MEKIFRFANRMRAEPTAAELRFFKRLEEAGIPAHPQVVIRRRYIADFVIPEKGLIIEVDGGIHNEPSHILKDAERDAFFKALGFRVLHIKNEHVGIYDLDTIKALPPASKQSQEYCATALKRTFGRKEPSVAFNSRKPKQERIYAAYVPFGESKVIVGKPRSASRYVQGKTGAYYKRFQSEAAAKDWLIEMARKPCYQKPREEFLSLPNSPKWRGVQDKFNRQAERDREWARKTGIPRDRL